MENRWILLVVFHVWSQLNLGSVLAHVNDDISCEYNAMTTFLHELAAKYNTTSKLVSIGTSEEEREIWTMIVSDSSDNRPLLRPQVKFVGNVNGMSGPACYILLRLAKNFLEEYENEGSMERQLMDSIEIHIIPNLNPDGYARAIPGSCSGKEGRLNANNVNLNTNFPDIFGDREQAPLQKETEAMMHWIRNNKFIISVSLISGAHVVSYPFDSIPVAEVDEVPLEQPHETPDADIFKNLALTYAQRTEAPEEGWFCPGLRRNFPGGIINGAEWHPQSGTMMDFNYLHGTMEIMVGVSCCRNENNHTLLNDMWWNNREGLLHVIHEVEGGIRGQVLDAETYFPIHMAKLSKRRPNYDSDEEELFSMPWYTSEGGEFWRPWTPGDYSLRVEKEGYITAEIPVQVHSHQPTFIRVEMKRFEPTTEHVPTTTPISIQEVSTTDEHVDFNKTTALPVKIVEKATEKASGTQHEHELMKNSQHFSSLTKLEHSFIGLGLALRNSADTSKKFGNLLMLTVPLLLFHPLFLIIR